MKLQKKKLKEKNNQVGGESERWARRKKTRGSVEAEGSYDNFNLCGKKKETKEGKKNSTVLQTR